MMQVSQDSGKEDRLLVSELDALTGAESRDDSGMFVWVEWGD